MQSVGAARRGRPGDETQVSASVPGLQVPERRVIAEPRIGQFRRCHKGVVLRVLLGVADQTDTDRDGDDQDRVTDTF